MICETCKQEMRFVPAGISKKTNKPYNGFWACDNKCPKKTQYSTNDIKNAPQANFGANSAITQAQERKGDMIELAMDRKEAGIRTSQAKTIAGEITAAMIHAGELKSSDWFIKFKEIAREVYAYTPEKPPFN
jgi:hypothetical protein